MDVIRLDVVENALICVTMMNERLPSRSEFTPSATLLMRQYPARSLTHQECITPVQHRHLQNIVALFLAAGKTNFTERVNKSSGIFRRAIFSSINPENQSGLAFPGRDSCAPH